MYRPFARPDQEAPADGDVKNPMTPALHKPAYNRAKTARVGAFAQLDVE